MVHQTQEASTLPPLVDLKHLSSTDAVAFLKTALTSEGGQWFVPYCSSNNIGTSHPPPSSSTHVPFATALRVLRDNSVEFADNELSYVMQCRSVAQQWPVNSHTTKCTTVTTNYLSTAVEEAGAPPPQFNVESLEDWPIPISDLALVMEAAIGCKHGQLSTTVRGRRQLVEELLTVQSGSAQRMQQDDPMQMDSVALWGEGRFGTYHDPFDMEDEEPDEITADEEGGSWSVEVLRHR